MTESIIIVGASARAAAFSALRAGIQPWVVDRFADADLAAWCDTRKVERISRHVVSVFNDAPDCPWMYTGPLENQPRLVARLARIRPLLGNTSVVLKHVRDPWTVASIAADAGFYVPEILPQAAVPPTEGAWLRKKLGSSGGGGISLWRQGTNDTRRRSGSYFQQLIEGTPMAAVFAGNGRTARMLGVSRQLVGETWCSAAPFNYCGSIGPAFVSRAMIEQLGEVGTNLTERSSLMGLFGVDFVSDDSRCWVIEVNPRYTASVEILELAAGIDLLPVHFAACAEGSLPTEGVNPRHIFGKAILFAPEPTELREKHFREVRAMYTDARAYQIADVPNPGTRIERGEPVLTVFASADSESEVEQSLRLQIELISTLLRSH